MFARLVKRMIGTPAKAGLAVRRRATRWGRDGLVSDDVFESLASANQFLSRLGLPTLDAHSTDCTTEEATALRILTTLLDSWACRRKYPLALTAGPDGSFSRYCQRGLTDDEKSAFRRAFARDWPCRPERVWQHRADLRERFPDALLPSGRTRFLEWLLPRGRPEFDLSVAECLWWACELIEAPIRGVVESYRVNSEWRTAFPHGLTKAGWPDFLATLRREFRLPSTWLARHPGPDESTPESDRGVNLIAPWRTSSGLRHHASSLREAIRSAGIAVAEHDIPVGGPTDLTERGRFLSGEPFDISAVVLGLGTDPRYRLRAAGLAESSAAYRIGVLFWEAEAVPTSMAPHFEPFHELWASTEYLAAAFRTATKLPIHVIRPSLALPPISPPNRTEFGLRDDEFVFTYAFDFNSSLARKNPAAVVEAFSRAVRPGDRARLILKVNHEGPIGDDSKSLRELANRPDVTLVAERWPYERVLGLISRSDCYVSLHRAEGLGLTLGEAMLLGKPVVATGYSGNVDFMTAENSLLVEYRRVETTKRDHPYPTGLYWADPSIDHAAAHIRWVLDHRDEAKRLGERARADAERFWCSLESRRQVRERIAAIREERAPIRRPH